MRGNNGNTIAEYGLIFALILIVAVASLGLLGGSISDLLGRASSASGGGGAASPNQLMGLLSSNGSAGGSGGEMTVTTPDGSSVSIPTDGFAALGTKPNGTPVVKVDAPSSATNTTSVEGGMWNTLGSISSAKTLDRMADKSSDPNVKAYLKGMADKIYLMGAAQAELDNVPELDVPNYVNADAIKDLWSYQKDLQQMMSSPPAGMSQRFLQKALAEATDAYNINQSYLNVVQQKGIIDANGNTTGQSFTIADETANGGPGSLIGHSTEIGYTATVATGQTVATVMSPDTVRAKAEVILTDNKVDSAKVEATLTDGVDVDAVTSQIDAAMP